MLAVGNLELKVRAVQQDNSFNITFITSFISILCPTHLEIYANIFLEINRYKHLQIYSQDSEHFISKRNSCAVVHYANS